VSWWSDIVAAVESAAGGESGVLQSGGQTAAGPVTVPQPLGGLIDTINAIWANLRDYKMWRSLGWLVLGIVLMFLGVLWWIGPSASRAGPAGLAAGAARRLA
jgi:hypothetical protein